MLPDLRACPCRRDWRELLEELAPVFAPPVDVPAVHGAGVRDDPGGPVAR